MLIAVKVELLNLKYYINEIRSNFQQTFHKKPQKLYGSNEAQKSGGFQQQ